MKWFIYMATNSGVTLLLKRNVHHIIISFPLYNYMAQTKLKRLKKGMGIYMHPQKKPGYPSFARLPQSTPHVAQKRTLNKLSLNLTTLASMHFQGWSTRTFSLASCGALAEELLRCERGGGRDREVDANVSYVLVQFCAISSPSGLSLI